MRTVTTLTSVACLFLLLSCSSLAFAYPIADRLVLPVEGYTDDSCSGWGAEVPDGSGGTKKHLADDYCASIGTAVTAIGKGRVKYTLYDPDNSGGSGWYGLIIMEHELPNGQVICSLYGHCQAATSVGVGDEIDETGAVIGQIIEYPPSSDHIHFGIYNGAYESSEGTYPVWAAGYLPVDEWPGQYLDPVAFVDSHSGIETCWPAEVVLFDRPTGSSSDGGPPEAALGPPDNAYVSVDIPETLILGFAENAVVQDGEGDDLFLIELGEDGSRADIYASEDNVNYVYLGRVQQDGSFDLSGYAGLSNIRYMKIVGLDNEGSSAGYDLDAIEAPHCLVSCNDSDGDGYGSPASSQCTHNEFDCSDSNLNIFPNNPNPYCDCAEPNPQGTEESEAAGNCADGVDNDCDGLSDSDPECCVAGPCAPCD